GEPVQAPSVAAHPGFRQPEKRRAVRLLLADRRRRVSALRHHVRTARGHHNEIAAEASTSRPGNGITAPCCATATALHLICRGCIGGRPPEILAPHSRSGGQPPAPPRARVAHSARLWYRPGGQTASRRSKNER